MARWVRWIAAVFSRSWHQLTSVGERHTDVLPALVAVSALVAVPVTGVIRVLQMFTVTSPYWAPAIAQLYRRVGNPETDAEFLWSRSPLSRASDIRIPLLIAQGANDPRVKQAESEQIVAALTEAGIDHEYLLFPDEGHGFAKPANRMVFYAAAEKFLAKHLGGRAEE